MTIKKSGPLARSVSIIGVGYTPSGDVLKNPEILNATEGDLIGAATIEALDDAGLDASDIDAYSVGVLASAYASQMANQSAMVSGWMGMKGKPGLSHDELCCTGNIGIQHSAMMVASGVYDIVLCAATGISNSATPMGLPRLPVFNKFDDTASTQASLFSVERNYSLPGTGGILSPAEDALSMYGRKNNLTKEDIWTALNRAHIIARRNGVENPKALMATELYEDEAKRFGFNSVDEYLNNPVFNPRIGTIMRAKDTNFFVDSASAVILCPTELAKKICKHPIVEIAGFGATNLWQQDVAEAEILMNKKAAKMAYAMAGITDPVKELDYLSIHDCNCGNWLTFPESVGYVNEGDGYKAIMEGWYEPNGKKPINTSGGRQGFGHPLASSNLVELAEIVQQMRGECGERQMKNPPKLAGIQAYANGFTFTMNVLRAL